MRGRGNAFGHPHQSVRSSESGNTSEEDGSLSTKVPGYNDPLNSQYRQGHPQPPGLHKTAPKEEAKVSHFTRFASHPDHRIGPRKVSEGYRRQPDPRNAKGMRSEYKTRTLNSERNQYNIQNAPSHIKITQRPGAFAHKSHSRPFHILGNGLSTPHPFEASITPFPHVSKHNAI